MFALLLLLVVALGGLIGARGASDEVFDENAVDATEDPQPASLTVVTREAEPPPDDFVVAIERRGSTFRSFPVIVGVADRDVITVHAKGFPPGDGGVVQCVLSSQGAWPCTNELPVHFDDDGAATVLARVTAEIPGLDGRPVDCTAPAAPCVLTVGYFGDFGMADLVFGSARPVDGRLVIGSAEPAGDGVAGDGVADDGAAGGRVRDSEAITLRLSGFPPGSSAAIVRCAAPDRRSVHTCDPPAAGVAVTFDDTGAARAEIVVHEGRVGLEDRPCDRDSPCSLSVVSDEFVWSGRPTSLRFSEPPGASYEPGRLMLGLVAAGLLVAVGAVLVRRTDWSIPERAPS